MIDQIYRITAKRQLTLLSSMILIHAIVISIYFYNGFEGNVILLLGYLVFFLFDAVPTVVLHLEYLTANLGTTLIVRDQHRTLSYTKKGEHLDYSFDDIEQVIYVAGYGNGAWYSFSEYRYFVLSLKLVKTY